VVLIEIVVYRQVENYCLSPRISAKTIELLTRIDAPTPSRRRPTPVAVSPIGPDPGGSAEPGRESGTPDSGLRDERRPRPASGR
jgi:hypothetical protein